MHNFRKAFISTLCFILLFAVISAVVIIPYWNSDADYFQDAQLREELSGQITCFALGASHALTAFDPMIMDEKLDCCSYNLSGSMMTLDGKYHLLKKELARNPVDTVFLEVSFDTLNRREDQEFAIGDEVTISRLDSTSERLSYLTDYVSVDDYLNLYSRHFITSLSHFGSFYKSGFTGGVDKEKRGYTPSESSDLTLSPESAINGLDTQKIAANYSSESVEKLNRLVELCKSYDIRLIFVVTPLSDSLLWKSSDMDSFYTWLSNYCKDIGCELYDLNLIRDRYSLFNDSTSFKDLDHLSNTGAEIFTSVLCDICNLAKQGHSVSDRFYRSYEALKADSPYMKYMEP